MCVTTPQKLVFAPLSHEKCYLKLLIHPNPNMMGLPHYTNRIFGTPPPNSFRGQDSRICDNVLASITPKRILECVDYVFTS